MVEAFNQARTALFYRIRGQHRHARTQRMIRYYFAAQDIHERANSTHFDYRQIAEQLKNTDLIFRIQRLLELQAQACHDITACLRQNTPYHYNIRVEKALMGTIQSLELYSKGHTNQNNVLLALQTLIDNLQSINWQLRQLEQETTENEQTAQIHTEQITGLKNILSVIGSNFTFESPLFRHAIRLSIIGILCCAIVEFFQFNLGLLDFAYRGLCLSTKLFRNQSAVTPAYYWYDFRGNYWLLIAISQSNIRDETWLNGGDQYVLFSSSEVIITVSPRSLLPCKY